MNKLVKTLREAITLSGVKDGMRISFHHHLRNGDYVLNMVLAELAAMGIMDLTVSASSVFDIQMPLIDHIKSGVVTGLEVSYMSGGIGKHISQGVLAKAVDFRSHGGRPAAIASGETSIDVAFIAAPTSDAMGNCSGKYGPSACGSLGYAFADAMYADKVVVITDNLVPHPFAQFSIPENYVDYVVEVEKIGDPNGIVSGTTRITRDPVGLMMATYATRVIQHSGLLKDGFSFQTGAGGASLAVAKYLKDLMLEKGVKGSFGMGGITAYLVDMLEEGCFESLVDVQCFDLKAVESIRNNPRHREVTATLYASPSAKSSLVDNLDVVILGATEIDTNFNVNVHTDSNGYIIGGSGGHNDTAAGAKLTMIIAPLTRARLSIVQDRVTTITTPGDTVDVLVTQRGIAVNPKQADLAARLSEQGLPIVDIHELKAEAERITGVPKKVPLGDRIVGNVIYRDGTLIDTIKNVL